MKCNYNGCSSKCKGDIDAESCNVLRAYQQGKADGFQEALTSNGIKLYVDKIKADGARKFLVWYSGGETMPSFGRYAKCNIDDVIAEWQKGKKDE